MLENEHNKPKDVSETLEVTGVNGLAPTDSLRFPKQWLFIVAAAGLNWHPLEGDLDPTWKKKHQFTCLSVEKDQCTPDHNNVAISYWSTFQFSTIMYIWDRPAYLHFQLQEWRI